MEKIEHKTEKRTEQINFSVTPEEKSLLEKAYLISDVKQVGDFIRKILLGKCKRIVKNSC